MSSGPLQYPQWQKPFLQAVMEMKPGSLAEKINTAETAIFERLRESAPTLDSEELVGLLRAISTLQSLRRVLPESDGQRMTDIKRRDVTSEIRCSTTQRDNEHQILRSKATGESREAYIRTVQS